MSDPSIRWPRAYLWLIGGFVALIFTANAIMVTVALSSWRGLQAEEPYIQGLNYNDELARRAQQAALGWQLGVDVEQTGPLSLAIAVTPVDGGGRLLTDAEIDGMLVRPTQEGLDVPIRLVAVGPRYAGAAEVSMPGIWDLRLTIRHGEETLGHQERVFLAP